MKLYRAKLKSRKRIMAEIPREQQGWWADVCAGQTLTLRDASAADLARCSINEGQSRDPADYLCEACERGSLVRRVAIESLVELADRRAPVSAPLDTQALPPPSISTGNCFPNFADAADQPYYSADQVRNIIAHLERELDQARGAYQGCATALEIANRAAGEERKPASIDTPEFQSKVGNWSGAAHSSDKYTRTIGAKEAWAALIAYIDGRTAGTAPAIDPFAAQRFLNWNRSQPKPLVEIGKELGVARKVMEFAAAPSPLPPKEETK